MRRTRNPFPGLAKPARLVGVSSARAPRVKPLTGAATLVFILAGVLTPAQSSAAGDADPALQRRISNCVPVEVRAAFGGRILANTRLARIEDGRVPCMHIEEMTTALCVFSMASGSESGKWVETPEGSFAQIGQALSRDGKPGGDYVVAARVGAVDSAFCIEPTGMDTAGRVSPGVELAIACVVEEVLMPWNALSVIQWAPLVNVATLEVCSRNNPATVPHPDGSQVVRSYAQPGSAVDDTFCYSGWGAALNDINGTERDETTAYRIGEGYCHMIVSGGFEVPGAKRPATKSLPAPGIVNDKSYIVWRPVNPNILIAN